MDFIAMLEEFKKIPNLITLSRLLCSPILLYLAYVGERYIYGIFIIYYFGSDVLDGTIARTLRQTSSFGAKFDSVVDDFSSIPLLIQVYWLFPDLAAQYGIYMVSLVVLLGIGYVFRIFFAKNVGIHLWSSKIFLTFAVLFYLYVIFVGFNYSIFIVFVVLGVISNLEVILVTLFKKDVSEYTRSIFG